ncbi:hypothetical protein N337_08403, partial [Phoenicopterus ruber ruber]
AAPAGPGQGTYGDLLLRVTSAAAHAGSPWSGTGSGPQLWTRILLTLPAHSTGFEAGAYLATPPTLSIPHTLWLEGCFPHLNSRWGCASPAQAGFAGQAALPQAEQAEALGRAVPGTRGMLQSALQQGFKLCTGL